MRLIVAIVVIGMLSPLSAPRAEAGEAMLLRVFLADGTAVVSYGEYARVGDRVVFSIPLGGEASQPALQLVNLPAADVDWARTTAYAHAARAAQYAATLGESDFALMTARAASALNDLARLEDEAARLDLARRARDELEQWPGRHYGYRAADVSQFVAILDEIITALRAAAGETRFELNLVAAADPPPPVPLLAAPSLQESVGSAMALARLSDVPADRLSLWSRVAAVLDARAADLPPRWVRDRRREVRDAIDTDVRAEKAYGHLAERTMREAAKAASRADVRQIERVIEDVHRRDARLGHQRPAAIGGLLTAVQARLAAARRLRLARDHWTLRQPAYRAYQRAIEDAVHEFDRNRSRLDAIRRLAGPDASTLIRLAARFQTALRQLGRIRPPDELGAVHTLLVTALQLATNAADVRTEAVRSGEESVAWNASAAAAGAFMLVSRAQADLDELLAFPQLR